MNKRNQIAGKIDEREKKRGSFELVIRAGAPPDDYSLPQTIQSAGKTKFQGSFDAECTRRNTELRPERKIYVGIRRDAVQSCKSEGKCLHRQISDHKRLPWLAKAGKCFQICESGK